MFATTLCAAFILMSPAQPAAAQVVVTPAPAPVVVAPTPVVVAPPPAVVAPPVVVVAPRPIVCHWIARREPDNGYYGWHWRHYRVCD
ncbi:hypothetical protein DBA20_17125 [Pandoraea capi]|nr:hypothetical protein [Pandoraea sp. LA3]MDN4584704.1 hypothetical protein [Pandoraea capi]